MVNINRHREDSGEKIYVHISNAEGKKKKLTDGEFHQRNENYKEKKNQGVKLNLSPLLK